MQSINQEHFLHGILSKLEWYSGKSMSLISLSWQSNMSEKMPIWLCFCREKHVKGHIYLQKKLSCGPSKTLVRTYFTLVSLLLSVRGSSTHEKRNFSCKLVEYQQNFRNIKPAQKQLLVPSFSETSPTSFCLLNSSLQQKVAQFSLGLNHSGLVCRLIRGCFLWRDGIVNRNWRFCCNRTAELTWSFCFAPQASQACDE